MDEINPEFIERYQKMYEQDPKSRIFAPLAEAYRKLGLIKEALQVAEKGVKDHPHFPGGHVALGRIYLHQVRLPEAETEFRKAIELSPENVLAYQLLAETYLRLRRSKDALKAYKMLLFMNPENERALNAVRKLESLTADEYEDDLFSMKPLEQAVKEWDEFQLDLPGADASQDQVGLAPKMELKKKAYLERALSLADAHIVRNDVDRALNALNEAERLFGPEPEITKRLKLLHGRQVDSLATPKTSQDLQQKPLSLREITLDKQIDFLQDLRQKIKNRSKQI